MVDYLGSVLDGTLDYSSPYFVSSGAIGAFIVTIDGTTLRVYECTNIEAVGELDWTARGTFTVGAGFTNKARIISSREELDFYILFYKDQTGVKYSRSTTATPSFGAAVAVGATVIDTGHDHDELGCAVYDEMQVVYAPDGTTSVEDGAYVYVPYAATSKSGAFSLVTGMPAGVTRGVLGCMLARTATIFYAAMEKPVAPTVDPLETVTFHGVTGWQNYTITGAGTTSGLGADPPVAYNAVNTAGAALSNGVLVEVQFEADYILTGMSWVADQNGGNLTGKTFTVQIDFYNAEDVLLKRFTQTNSTQFIQAVTAADINVTEPVRWIEISLLLNWTSDDGIGINNVFIDNIAFEATLVTQESTRKLYQVTLPSTWLDVTPTQISVPITPYGMAFDYASPSSMSMLAVNEQGNTNLLNTSTGGSSWSTHKRDVVWRGVKRGGDTLILWGYNTIDLSPDEGFTFYSRRGNFVATVGALDEIRWLAGVL